ncbi:MAG: hypothetical protein J6U13_06705 [Salinivirgaceae bacterium]|nr:hypothetical protein [Salinivirgaceae bacterium]
MSKETKNDVITSDLRKQLKSMLATEIQKLPDYLSELDTEKRIGFLIKLMPFVFPKVDSVSMGAGETDWEF